MSKSKGKAVAMVDDESDYGQSLSEDEQESEERELAAQCFQRMQQNKRLASKKANVAKARDVQQHWAINDFSGCIPDRLEVKVWGPNNVEQLNFNTVHVGADANQAAALEHNSCQQAKVPTTTIVYKYAPRGLPCTPYELEQLYKYYANEHVPHRDHVVTYMLISELLLFVQQLDNSLQDRTMQICVVPGLCANSAAKSSVVRRLALVMAQPGMYHEAVASYNAAFSERPLVAQYGFHLNILQVHVPDDQACNFLDNDALHVLLHNHILLDWVDHAYTYGMVYLEQQFHNPTMSMDIFKDVDNERIEHVSCYGTPPTIPQWDGWREMTEDDHYRLMFKRAEERLLPVPPEATGLYYYIEMDPNWVHLWKRMAAHVPSVPTATNIALTELSMVDATVVSGPLTPPRTKLAPHKSATNIAIGNVAMMLESGEVLKGNAGHEP
ncbi:hypothetical protein C0995_010481 [Termitomyces sp. Mi166|nr:hypothetical protein C0995_010481 [Termitomyces sp. Mi166\